MELAVLLMEKPTLVAKWASRFYSDSALKLAKIPADLLNHSEFLLIIFKLINYTYI